MNWVDIISLAVWGSGALAGLAGGLFRIWVPLLFLLASLGIAGGLDVPAGSRIFFFIESESRQVLAGFFLVFLSLLGIGAFVTKAAWRLLSVGSSLTSLVPFGSLLNRVGGLLLGALTGLILVSVVLSGLQQYPVPAVGKAIAESSVASAPVAWIDRYAASIGISDEWQDRD